MCVCVCVWQREERTQGTSQREMGNLAITKEQLVGQNWPWNESSRRSVALHGTHMNTSQFKNIQNKSCYVSVRFGTELFAHYVCVGGDHLRRDIMILNTSK